MTLSVVGFAVSVKLAGAVTLTLIVAVLCKLPEVPVIVTVAAPTVAELLAVSVTVLVLVVLAGLKVAVTPLGNPEAERLTVAVKPFWGATVIELLTLVPFSTVKLAGDTEIV
jgi:hypothetical protein